jgi:purine catabolism regulator
VEVDRLRARGLLASAALSTADEHIVILPIGVRGSAEGFLVVGSPRPLRSADQAVMNLALSLLSWEASRPLAVDEGMDPWRRLLLSVAVDRGLTPGLVDSLGLSALDLGTAVAVTVRGPRGVPVSEKVLADANRVGLAVLCRRPSGELVGIARSDVDGRLPASLASLGESPDVLAIGVSVPLDLTDPANVRQAMEQADRAATLGSGVRHFGDEPSRGLAALLDAATTAAWADGYLGDLMTTAEGPELMDTLLAWLDQHGQVDAAAQRLGIHRHTVRHRLRRAEGVLGRELDDPEVRADLWFALAAVRRAQPANDAVGRG